MFVYVTLKIDSTKYFFVIGITIVVMQHDKNLTIWATVRSLISTLCIRVQKRDTKDGEVINTQRKKMHIW